MLGMFKERVRTANDKIRGTMEAALHFNDVSIAFQPIVNATTEKVWGFEALTRGVNGMTYPVMVANMSEKRRIAFDKMVAMKALREAARLGLTRNGAKVTLNVRPTIDQAAVDAAFVARVARHYGLDLSSLVLELTEDAKLSYEDFQKVVGLHRALGIATGIDDFGSGYSGLNVLASCGAAIVKLDRHLISGIDHDKNKQMIVESFTTLCDKLGAMVVAEGVETQAEAITLRQHGIKLMQGYYFGKPSAGRPSVLRLGIDEPETARVWEMPVKPWGVPLSLSA
jgi:EAL domain-containing protein (putative c-di-GMP-specific phosphodiesterase class I)